ncbi:hypothetical protein VNI00_001353 [Paramarasmius palmivorus]|uniref:Uncharacterized protein n=1 Tax=Paramarasmius palmivorus TaxID=297713 RepID=A0AAW0E8X4_9AGAR
MFSTIALILCASLLPFAFAAPTSGNICHPNFEGVKTSIYGSGGSILPGDVDDSHALEALWTISQNGQSSPSYIFKINGKALALDKDGRNLDLVKPSDSGNDPSQLFDITCYGCFSGASTAGANWLIAGGCTVKPHSSATKCVQANGKTGDVFVTDCKNNVVDQYFSFFT